MVGAPKDGKQVRAGKLVIKGLSEEERKEKINAYMREYYKNHSDQMRANTARYYENNKESLNLKHKEMISCPVCAREFTRGHLSKHEQSLYHLKRLDKEKSNQSIN